MADDDEENLDVEEEVEEKEGEEATDLSNR